jgi:glycosyltransferase involved in cell wall biosynthesis
VKILQGKNGGASKARNRAIAAAQGEFVTFLDADDLWSTDKLQAQYEALCADPHADVVYSWVHAMDAQGQLLWRCSEVAWTGDVWKHLLLDNFIGNGSNVMVRQSALDRVGTFDESMINAQDTDLWLRLAQQCHFTVVPKTQIFYRISQNSLSSRLTSVEASSLRIIEKNMRSATPAIQKLKPILTANLYKYMAYKALSIAPGKQDTKLAIRYLCQVLITDPVMVTRPAIYKGFIKLSCMVLLPSSWANNILRQMPQIANTATLLGYSKTKLPSSP